MKILYVSSALIPSQTANSINIMKSCHALALLGHEVVLLAPEVKTTEIDQRVRDPFRHYGIAQNFTLNKICCPDLPGGRSLYCLLAARYAKRFKPDLVYGRYLRATYQICKLGMPTVLELHSAVRFKGQKTRYFEKLLECPHLLALITLTSEMAKHYSELAFADIGSKPILVAGCGGDLATPVAVPARLPQTTNGYQIGFPGKLHKVKGLELIGELASQATNHDFHIFGGTPEEVTHWQSRYPTGNLHFHGFIAPGELSSYLAALDICLLPCQKNPLNPGQAVYGSPLKLFEYMAHGKAILASDLAEIHEVLDRDSGIFLDPENPGEWVDAIEQLTRDEINRLGQAARRKFEQEYTREARYDKLLHEILKLMRRKP